MTRKIIPPMLLALTVTACLGSPLIITNPATPASSLTCVRSLLEDFGYEIEDDLVASEDAFALRAVKDAGLFGKDQQLEVEVSENDAGVRELSITAAAITESSSSSSGGLTLGFGGGLGKPSDEAAQHAQRIIDQCAPSA